VLINPYRNIRCFPFPSRSLSISPLWYPIRIRFSRDFRRCQFPEIVELFALTRWWHGQRWRVHFLLEQPAQHIHLILNAFVPRLDASNQ